jgi:hypothetical protein
MKNDGGPAFPIPPIDNGPGNIKSQAKPGMSLRDWFAGMAMQGLLVHDDEGVISEAARDAYRYADAMLKAREASE